MASDEPPEKDMKDFEFVQLCKFRVNESDFTASTDRSQLLACSSAFGLVIYATKSGFNVVKTSDFLSIDEATGAQRNKVIVEEIPVLAKVTLPSSPLFLALSADGVFLMVIFKDIANQISIVFFDVHGFADKATSPQPFAKLPLNLSPGMTVVDIAWNPAVFSMLAVCYSDGCMALVDVSDNPRIVMSLPANVGVTCFSWSPKGKQLLVGKRDGTLSQYDHALTEKKKWDCPSVLAPGQTVVDVVWLSTYIFIAAYLPLGVQHSDQPLVVMTMSNKENKTMYINFDDVCFSNGEDRKPQYLFHNVLKWECVLMASSRATEATLIGKNLDNKTTWEHWNLEDSSRAELPLTGNQNDSFPLGMAVDYSPSKPVILSETKTFPACPVMFLLSTDGLLLAYHLRYCHKDAAPQITTPAQPLNPVVAKKGVPGLVGKQPTAPPSSAPQSAAPNTPFSATPRAMSGATTATADLVKPPPPYNAFTPSSVSKPAVTPAFQFGTPADSAAASSLANQKPPLLATPASQAQVSQGQPGGSSFAFTFGGAANKSGQSSAFASIPPSSSPAGPNPTPTGLKFGQPSSVPIYGSSTPVAKTGTPFMAPNLSAPRQTTPPVPISSQQVVTPPSSQPASSAATAMASGMGKSLQQMTAPMSQPQQPQQDPPSIFGSTAAKPAASLSISHPPVGGFGSQPPQLAGGAEVGTLPGGHLAAHYKSPYQPEASQGGVDSRASIEAALDSAFSQNIAEEMAHFEEEMKMLRLRSKRDVKVVGTRTELQSLQRDTEETVNYLCEIKDVVKDQLHEVQDLKSNCFNMFAGVEKSHTQLQRNNDPHYHSLLQGRALDPASAEQLKNIQQMSQVLEQTLSEVNHTLDSQWEHHLAQKSRQSRLSTPTGDTIYKSIKNNHQIISYQRRTVDKLEEKMCNLRLSSKESKGNRQSVFTLVAEETPCSARKQEFSPSLKKPLTLKAAVSNGMTPEKVSRVKDFLSQRRVSLVKPKTPANLSMSRIVSTTTPRRPASTSTPAPKSAPATNSQHLLQQQQGKSLSQQSQSPQQQQAMFGNAMSYQNTPTGIPPAELRLQKGPLMNPELPKPAMQDVRFSPQQPANSSPASIFGGSGSVGSIQHGGLSIQQPPQIPTQPRMGQPTSFSGVAYFKQPPAPNPPSGVRTGGLPPPQQQQHQQQIPADLQAASQVLSKHLGGGGMLNLPAMLSVEGDGKNAVRNQLQFTQPAVYEDITPTETDETNEDDDDEEDYEEEDNGYEDEDEEEYEDDEAYAQTVPFDGSGQNMSFFSVKNPPNAKESSSPQQGQGLNGSPSQGQASVPGFTNLSGMAPKNVFGVKPSTSPSSTAGATGATTSTGFTFGNTSAVFGQKIPAVTSSAGGTSAPLFGGSNLSRSVGFADLVTGADSTQTSGQSPSGTPSIFGGNPASSPGSKFGFSTTASPTAASSVPPPGVTKATTASSSGFSFMTAAAAEGSASSSGGSLFGIAKTEPSAADVKADKPKAAASPDSSSTQPAPVTSTSLAAPGPATTSIFGNAGPSFQFGSSSTLFGSNTVLQKSSPVIGSSTDTANTDDGGVAASTPALTPPASQVAPSPSAGNQASNSQLSALLSGAGASMTGSSSTATDSDVTTTKVSPPAGGGNILGSSATATTTTATLPGSGSSNIQTSSIFKEVSTTTGAAAPTTATTAATSIFGVNSSSTSSLFGGSGVAASSAPLFGGTKTATASVFGAAPAVTTSSIFGSTSSTSSPFFTDATSSTPLFGGNSAATVSTTPLFGASTTTSLPSLFGGPSSTPTTSTSLFGGAPSTSSTAPLFGSSSTSATSTPIFGTTTTTPFGSSTTSPPAFGSVFGASATTTTSASIFGSGGNGGSSFSFSTQPSGTGSSFGTGFGSGPTPAAAPSSFSFNQPATNSDGAGSGGGAASLFGGFGGLGAKPSEEKANTNVFGSPQTFSSSTAQNNLFGSSSSNPFGGGSFGGTGTAFTTGDGSGSFTSSGVGGVASTGFGVSNNPSATSSVFGSTPTFGSSPSFGGGGSAFGSGSKPGFGSPSLFGGGATFGSSTSTFGSSTSTFGSPANSGSVFGVAAGNASSPGFGSFAASSAPSFGQLAQGSPGGGFGSGGGQPSPFGGGGGGDSAFGGAPVFGQPAAAGGVGFGSPQTGFGNQGSNFGSSAAFSSYRG